MAARGYQGGSRPSLVRANTTVRYDRPRSRPNKRPRSSSRSAVKKQLMDMAETKIVRLFNAGGTSLTGHFACNAPPQGTGQHQRVGSRITVTGFYGRFQFRARNAQGMMRVIFYRPRDPTANLESLSLGVFDHIDPDEFVVYDDQLHPLSNANGPDWAVTEIKRKFPNGLITHFDDGTTTITENMLRIYIVGWNTITPDEHGYDCSLYYKDV